MTLTPQGRRNLTAALGFAHLLPRAPERGCLMLIGGLTLAMCVVFFMYAAIFETWNAKVFSYLGITIFALPLFLWGLSLFSSRPPMTHQHRSSLSDSYPTVTGAVAAFILEAGTAIVRRTWSRCRLGPNHPLRVVPPPDGRTGGRVAAGCHLGIARAPHRLRRLTVRSLEPAAFVSSEVGPYPRTRWTCTATGSASWRLPRSAIAPLSSSATRSPARCSRATPRSCSRGVLSNYRTMQNPWASMPRATLNLLR